MQSLRHASRRIARITRRARPILLVSALGLGCSRDTSAPEFPTGSIAVTVNGLPAGVQGAVSVSGPGGFTRTVTASATLTGLLPGAYVVTAGDVVTSLNAFVAAAGSQTVTVYASRVSAAVTVSYAAAMGSVRVTLNGLPPGAVAKVVLTNDAGFRDSVFASGTIGRLAPGTYRVTASDARLGPDVYSPKPATFLVSVEPSAAPVEAPISYALASGSLLVLVEGLPAGAPADISVTGPGGFQQSVGGSQTLQGVPQGRHELSAANVVHAGVAYAPSPPVQTVTVFAGTTSRGTVTYAAAAPAGPLNLWIDAVQIQQVVQTYGGTVPLVSGRDALVRVFARASTANTAAPSVRLRLYDGGSLVGTVTIPAPSDSVPTVPVEGALATSWNYLMPASLVRPGLAVLAEVDPDGVVAEWSEADNRYPSSGAPREIDVRDVPPLALRLVPVTQTATGLTGDVSAASAASFTAFLRRVLPLGAVQVEVRSPYTTSGPALQSNDANEAWQRLLSEIEALRAAEGSSSHYYGVVKTPYPVGVAGIASLPGRSAVGWDQAPSAGEILAHELGHNFGRFHAPCGSASLIDANFPYAGGASGVFGYDASSGLLRPPNSPDLMGYCTGRWTSDYTYLGIMHFRADQAASVLPAGLSERAVARPGLLVWGRLTERGVVLEPAFEVVAPPRLPARQGSARLELRGPSGEVLLALRFDAAIAADGTGGENRHFAFIVPLDALRGKLPSRLHLSTPVGSAERVSGAIGNLREALAPVVERLSPTRVRLTWRAAPGRGVMVRDARTGAILALSRDGSTIARTVERDVDLTLSDGVRSHRLRVAVRLH